jgi:hypothetical protein
VHDLELLRGQVNPATVDQHPPLPHVEQVILGEPQLPSGEADQPPVDRRRTELEAPVPGYPEGERANRQPGAQRGAVWGFVPVDDAIDQVGVGWGRRLDGELVGAAPPVSLADLRFSRR